MSRTESMRPGGEWGEGTPGLCTKVEPGHRRSIGAFPERALRVRGQGGELNTAPAATGRGKRTIFTRSAHRHRTAKPRRMPRVERLSLCRFRLRAVRQS